MTIISTSNNAITLHTAAHLLTSGIKNLIQGFGFGLLTLLLFAIPLGTAYSIFQFLNS